MIRLNGVSIDIVKFDSIFLNDNLSKMDVKKVKKHKSIDTKLNRKANKHKFHKLNHKRNHRKSWIHNGKSHRHRNYR